MIERKPDLDTFIVVSSSHVSGDCAKKLDEVQWGNPTTDREIDAPPSIGGPFGEVGWFMYAQEESEAIEEVEKAFTGLGKIFRYARANGVAYVLIDRDGPVIDSLPTYDW